MGKRVAIAIAVENYSDKRVKPVIYAEADATGFTDALEVAGPLDKVLILSARATKTSITSKLGQHVKALTPDDELFLFYAGHGFSKNGHNYITCHDTDPDDLADTSISLQSILDLCGKSACKRSALFLDSCESGITELPEVRGIFSEMSDKELKEFFNHAQYRVCFASCKTSESSYSSPTLKHGVWTYQIIQALSGYDPLALENGRYITANSLQNYIAVELPRTIRSVFTKPRVQTPWFHGSNTGDFLIADLKDVLEQRNAIKPGFEQVKQVFLQFVRPVDIKHLSGFNKKKGHFVPEAVTGASQSFVEDISREEVTERFNTVFNRIRNSMSYKRRDVKAEDGSIITPDFEFSITCEQDKDEPGTALLTSRLTNIAPTIVEDDAFNTVFGDFFDELTFEFNKRIDIKALIDRLEDVEKVELDYPPDCSYCDIEIDGYPSTLQVTRDSLTVQTVKPQSPKLLLQSFFDAQKQLAGTPIIKAIADGAA